ncbi:PA2779 family protein [Bowmanella sp. JS7-9]|uniref:PA2779 family protein n=1 Tax=Pseudobowmanella zhangzhouensis TaxID=1537679 RepID=A0ABW1XGN7_9ALTE|nr:PA2779 family protein [Bowmanella sp. JS7-9]TBX21260.1 hypothetical protein TK45_11855 [Bowmanella sp. JS7-9]
MKRLNSLLCGSLMALTAMAGTCHAGVVSSDVVMQQQKSFYGKAQLIAMVDRADVNAKLISLGVNRADAIARINALTDEEINKLNQELESAPAGGIVGAVLTVLAIIAILDLVGVTDVYPFIRPINS